MKYFVTGATGFIGGRLVERLVADGHEVVALVRSPEKSGRLRDLGVEIAQGDITDKASLLEPMRNVDGVFHVAAWYKIGARDKSLAERINVEGTRNVLETMRDLGIPKGVYTSTVAIYSNTQGRVVDESYRFEGEHLSEYDRTKWLAHYQVALPMAQSSLPLVIVLPSLVYGPGDASSIGEAFAQYLQGKLPMLPQKTAYCWTYIDDVVDGHVQAMEKGAPGEEYILAGPVHTMVEVFKMAADITGIPAPHLHPSPGLVRMMASLSALAGKIVSLPSVYDSETLHVLAGATYLADSSKAKRELGFNPRPLAEGLPVTLRAFMDELGVKVLL